MILYRFDRQPLEGFVNPSAYLLPDRVEWITLDGKLQTASYSECKAICFISETAPPDLFTENAFFERRPKVPGLWTRFTLRDGAILDGILSHNLLEWPAAGYVITPPKSGPGRQRVFLPRTALFATELRGVVGTSVTGHARRDIGTGRELADRQLNIFPP